MRRETVKQCTLERNGARQVSWIPSERAIQDGLVDLKEDGKWSRGWTVLEAFGTELDATVIQERGRDFKNHRKATDV
jgi:hypothetical protein